MLCKVQLWGTNRLNTNCITQETWACYTNLKGQGWDSKCETNEKDFHLDLPQKTQQRKLKMAANVSKKSVWACRSSYITNGDTLSSDLHFSWIKHQASLLFFFSSAGSAGCLKTLAGALIRPPFHRTAAILVPVKGLLWLRLTGSFSRYCTFTTLSIQKDFWECFCLYWKAKIVLSAIILQRFKSIAPRAHFCAIQLFQPFFDWKFDIGHFFPPIFLVLSTSCKNQCISM